DVVDDTSWFHVNGGLGGGEIGCNYQTGNWVVGIEVDGSWTALSGRANLIPPFNNNFAAETKERWLTMARGRAGYAYRQWLWYITGGVARADIDVQLFNELSPVNTTGVQRVNRVSWVAGLGTEYAVTYSWSVKLEALYMDFRTFRAFDVVNGVVCGCDSQDIKLNQWVAPAGLTYKWYSGHSQGGGSVSGCRRPRFPASRCDVDAPLWRSQHATANRRPAMERCAGPRKAMTGQCCRRSASSSC